MRSVVAALAIVAGCHAAAEPPDPPAPAGSAVAPWSFGDVDRTIDPCDDFYSFACGPWTDAMLKREPDQQIRDRSFNSGIAASEAFAHSLLERARLLPGGDPLLAQLGAFYGACMDRDAIARDGTAAFEPVLAAIAGVHDAASFGVAIAALQSVGANPLFTLTTTPADADPRTTAWEIFGSLLPLGVESAEALGAAQLSRYEQRIARSLVALGREWSAVDAAVDAGAIVTLETQIAKALDRRTDRALRRLATLDRAALAALVPHFAWDAFVAGAALREPFTVELAGPHYMAALDQIVTSTPWSVWRAYLAFRLVDAFAVALPPDRDSPDAVSRARACARATWSYLPDVTGQAYARARFDPAHARAANAIVAAIARAMAAELERTPWLDPDTRAAARDKLANIDWLVGAPARWNAVDVPLDRSRFAATVLELARRKAIRMRDAVGQPTNREDWRFTVAEVNAQYVPARNAIEIPAAILDAPFFDPSAPAAVNLGSIGAIIGHELTHAFDDQGAEFDATGNQRDWWRPATREEFARRTSCMIDQFDRYGKPSGEPPSGKFTIGENIADLGGLELAFAAYRGLHNEPATAGASFSDDQRFFLSFAQTWCSEYPLTRKGEGDGHSAPLLRVNATVAAMPEFAAAFSCKRTARLAPAGPCVVW